MPTTLASILRRSARTSTTRRRASPAAGRGRCKRLTSKTARLKNTPPYSARACPGMIMTGGDGRVYRSTLTKSCRRAFSTSPKTCRPSYRWVAIA